MDFIEFNNKKYPIFQSEGNAAQFCIPFAKQFCKGIGYDIGFSKMEWKFENAKPIDISYTFDQYNANCLPANKVDYIFSSHCLEHVPNWANTLDYWMGKVKKGGVIFLYLPHYEQEYWRSWNNLKHVHNLNTEMLVDFFKSKGVANIVHSTGYDLNHCFTIVVEI